VTTTTEPATELVDGQIYRWRWKDEARDRDNAPYRSYHCKSQIAIVRNGRLYDTFWSTPSYEHEVDADAVTLTHYADESWPTISEWDLPYYASDDVASMRHSNNSGALIYLRPGATKNAERIRAEIDWRIEKAESEIRSAQSALERLAEAKALLADGRVDEVRL
jgi:hypothetical protein